MAGKSYHYIRDSVFLAIIERWRAELGYYGFELR
jgi:hypothetical protein